MSVMQFKGELKLPRPTGRYHIRVFKAADIEGDKVKDGAEPRIDLGWGNNLITDLAAVDSRLGEGSANTCNPLASSNVGLRMALSDDDSTPDASATSGTDVELIASSTFGLLPQSVTNPSSGNFGSATFAPSSPVVIMPTGATSAEDGRVVSSIKTHTGAITSSGLRSWHKITAPITVEVGDVFVIDYECSMPILAADSTVGSTPNPWQVPGYQIEVTPRIYAYGEDPEDPAEGVDGSEARWLLTYFDIIAGGNVPATTRSRRSSGTIPTNVGKLRGADSGTFGNTFLDSGEVTRSASGLSETYLYKLASTTASVAITPRALTGVIVGTTQVSHTFNGTFPSAITSVTSGPNGALMLYIHPDDIALAPTWGPGQRFELEIELTISVEPYSG